MKIPTTIFLSAVLGACLIAVTASTHAATLTVTSSADSGVGTLRDTLASAANGDTINFSNIATITLTNGELLVTNNVTILGPGPANLAVNGNANRRVFHVQKGAIATIASLTITNGKALGDVGGGIWSIANRDTNVFGNALIWDSQAKARADALFAAAPESVRQKYGSVDGVIYDWWLNNSTPVAAIVARD